MKPTAVLLAIAVWAAPALAARATGPQWGAQSRAVSSSVGRAAEPLTPEPVQLLAPRQLTATAGDGRGDETRPAGLLERLMAAAGRGEAMVKAGSAKVPALVLVLSAMLILPVAALASWAVQRAARARARRAGKSAHVATDPAPDGATALADTRAWSAQAWLAIEGDTASAHRIDCEMLRIGRHPDNEVWLPEDSVHRYHAVIHRTEDAAFVITDLSGEAGNGMHVNGTRRSEARLAHGDVIELGRARLTFASTPI